MSSPVADTTNTAQPEVVDGGNTTTSTSPKMRTSRIPKVLTWKDPVHSGTVLAEILGTLFIMRYGNLLRLFLRVTYWAIAITGSVEFITRQIHHSDRGLVSNYGPSRYINVNHATIEKAASRIARYVNECLNELNKIFDAEDLSLSLLAFFTAVFMYILTGYVTVSGLLFIATAVAFTVPILYLQFHKEIDQAIDIGQKEVNKHCSNASSHVHSVAGPHIEKARSHVSSLASSLGYSRGGFPETPEDKKSAPVASPDEIPGAAAVAGGATSSSRSAPKVSQNAKTFESSTGSKQVDSTAVAESATSTETASSLEQPSIAPTTGATKGQTDNAAPDAIGDVSLNPPDAPGMKDSAVEEAKNAGAKLDSSVPDLASDLKSQINQDKTA